MAEDEEERRVHFPELQRSSTATQPAHHGDDCQIPSGRRRSSSDPQRRPGLNPLRGRRSSRSSLMSQIPENTRLPSTALFSAPSTRGRGRTDQLDSGLADVLDVIDPEVSTLNNVTNIQNSLFIPSLGRFVNRRPTYRLSKAPEQSQIAEERQFEDGGIAEDPEYQYNFVHAVLPDGVSLDGWTEAEKAELNDHVRHMLHSRRSKFRRNMRAFGQYVRTPLGFFVTLYGTLITLFGLAWVLFLIGWIYVAGKQLYLINIIDFTLVALFGLVGDGLAPFRAVDTYHMAFIARYHRLTWKLRRKKRMANLRDKNDLPTTTDVEQEEISVLTDEQQANLVYHQNKFAKSHTFYKPHETRTHYAFPLNYLVAIVTLLDLHSCLQICLGCTTYGIPYRQRPAALTATILSCSITVNITAGILISVGGRKTRKKEVVERMFRQELTREALDIIRHEAKKQDDTEKQQKAENVIDQARKSETFDEAMRSHKSTPLDTSSRRRWAARAEAVKWSERPHSHSIR
ncbi:hypothetical protein GGR56DRAFT_665635 [Xylariaceae sp. FL0804]|nr:hypothetical protein GGR56DRAFT_665635 [Xylariaceae sp. FL0804]